MATEADILSEQLLKAASIVEEQVDRELTWLDKLDDDEMDRLRKQRLAQVKKVQQQRQDWLSIGHGQYQELPDEKSFFEACKKSSRLVCLFGRPSSERSRIFDHHLAILAPRHLATRFVHLNAEKTPFLASRLNIRVLPTIVIVVDAKTVDYVRGFEQLGGVDDFQTDVLERRLTVAGVLKLADGGKTADKDSNKTRRNIRDNENESGSDSDF